MRLKDVAVVAGLVVSVVSNVPSVIAAEHERAPWSKACSAYNTPKDLVGASAEYCLRQPLPTRCLQHTEMYFESCRFQGNFKKLSQKVHAKMLVVLALSRFASVPEKRSS
jgi:hypothetical protein